MARALILALASTAAMAAAGSAQAGSVTWSIGISAPAVTTVVSNAPGYRDGYVDDAATVHVPVPVYATAPVVYEPPPRVFGPPQVPYPVPHWAPRGQRPEWRGDWRRDERRHGHDHDRRDRDAR